MLGMLLSMFTSELLGGHVSLVRGDPYIDRMHR